MTMRQYEIVNMSDACTVEADDPTIAAVAVLLIGEGSWGLESEDDETVLNLIFLGGEEALKGFLVEKGIEDLGEYVDANRDAIADVLDSAMYGKYVDRRAYNKGLELLGDDEAKKQEWREHWETERRSSMTQICKIAWSYAKRLREGKPEDAVETA